MAQNPPEPLFSDTGTATASWQPEMETARGDDPRSATLPDAASPVATLEDPQGTTDPGAAERAAEAEPASSSSSPVDPDADQVMLRYRFHKALLGEVGRFQRNSNGRIPDDHELEGLARGLALRRYGADGSTAPAPQENPDIHGHPLLRDDDAVSVRAIRMPAIDRLTDTIAPTPQRTDRLAPASDRAASSRLAAYQDSARLSEDASFGDTDAEPVLIPHDDGPAPLSSSDDRLFVPTAFGGQSGFDIFSGTWNDGAVPRPFLERFGDALGVGGAQVAEEDRARLNEHLRTVATTTIRAAVAHIRTTSLARTILQNFLSGSGPREFHFGPDSEGVRELFSTRSGGYYKRAEIEAMRFLAYRKYRTGILRDGYSATEIRMRAFNPGDMVHGFRDGIDLGDITGTLSGGLEAWVKGGRVYFRAENRMNPVSFGGGNLLPAQQAWIDMPGDGPLSQIVIHYEWSSPIPQYLRPKE